MAEETPKISNSGSSCLVHSQKYRSRFYHIINVIRDQQIVPLIYMDKINGIVCNCHSYHFHDGLDDIILHKNMTEVSDTLAEKLEADDQIYLKKILLTMTNSKKNHDTAKIELSYNRLLYMLSQVVVSNSYDILSYKKVPEQSKDELLTIPEVIFAKTFAVEIPHHQVGFIFGSRGRHIRTFQKEHNCSLRMMKQTREHLSSIKTFELKTKSVSTLNKIQNSFINYVQAVLQKRKIQDEKEVRFHEERRSRLLARMKARKIRHAAIGFSGNTSPYVAATELKETSKMNYSVKYHHLTKSKDNRKLRKEQPTQNVLESSDSRCANCLQPYNKEENTEDTCRYHPGYIDTHISVKSTWKWQCCYQEAKDKSMESQRDDHHDNGCKTGRHVWKTHKKASVSKKYAQSAVDRDTWMNLKHTATCNTAKNVPKAWLNQKN